MTDADPSDESSPAPGDAVDPAFETLLTYLKESRAFDFTGYKRASLMRRVRHQMRQVGIPEFDDYLDFLQVHPEEFTALFDTILINVTSFFRDAETWEQLAERELPRVLEGADDQIRLWCAGCATGQEAYTLAILLVEALGAAEYRRRVKIYATDIDESALAVARQAVYTERETRSVPADFLGKYFDHGAGRYTFRGDLRRNVIFGRNDLVQDAPISRIDILTCRNTLMYFNAETQSRIVSRLGFALKPNGLLFLGKAEMLLNHTATFQPIDLKRRFFRKAPTSGAAEVPAPDVPRQISVRRSDDSELRALRSEAFLSSPVAQLVVDGGDRLALLNHRAGSMLGLSERDVGRPFQDLEVSYRPAELRSQLSTVRESGTAVWLRDVEWHRSQHERMVLDIQLLPLSHRGGRVIGVAIMLNDVSRFRQLQDELESANRQLETAYEELQSTNEELETTNEELQSTVEELETTNEELQSTNEELETMNEELQSMTDELQTTNEKLRDRTTEITSLNQFMESILGSLRAAVVVVDRDLVVQVWNPRAEDLWGLREDETTGVHLLNLDSGLPADERKPLIRRVIFEGVASDEAFLDVVNRRGRAVRLRVTVTPLISTGAEPTGALILMDPAEPAS